MLDLWKISSTFRTVVMFVIVNLQTIFQIWRVHMIMTFSLSFFLFVCLASTVHLVLPSHWKQTRIIARMPWVIQYSANKIFIEVAYNSKVCCNISFQNPKFMALVSLSYRKFARLIPNCNQMKVWRSYFQSTFASSCLKIWKVDTHSSLGDLIYLKFFYTFCT
jgi:hypothetical protein